MSGQLDGDAVRDWLKSCLAAVESKQAELDRLDAVAGDGDHGATMVGGLRAACRDVDAEAPTPGVVLRDAAASFASVGGSIGPLWGTALLRAGRVAGERRTLEEVLGDSAQAALEGMMERGRCEVGAKTLIDAMAPAVEELKSALEQGSDPHNALVRAAEAAAKGRDATAEMTPTRGRARRLAERSVGSIDPGAASCAILWACAGSQSVTDKTGQTPQRPAVREVAGGDDNR